jgi:branched-chain amino acid transport system ATP-binding protein
MGTEQKDRKDGSMLLDVMNLDAGYAKKQILFNVSLSVAEGEIVSLIGHNGAGKSTSLKAIFGLLAPMAGQINYMNQDVTTALPATKLDAGIYNVPQEEYLFNDLSVFENLEMSFFTMADQSLFESRLDEVFTYFPVLKQRQHQLSGTLSGGERRMLGIGMGLLRHPRLLMLDEPSSGLSPIMFQAVIDIITEINRSKKMAVLLVEQNVKTAFKISQRVYVMKAGCMIMEKTGVELLEQGQWWDLF